MNTIRKLLLTALATASLAVSSNAGTLYLWDGLGNNVTVNDDGTGDNAAGLGVINWGGTMGTWTVFISSTGTTTGSLSSPTIDLNVVATGNGFLGAYYGDIGFGPTNGSVKATIGGTLVANATVDNKTFLYLGNNVTPPGYATYQLTGATYTGNPFSGTEYSSINEAGPYALYEAIYLTHRGYGTSSFDANLSVPDSASTALMIGLGLLGLGLAARRNKVA